MAFRVGLMVITSIKIPPGILRLETLGGFRFESKLEIRHSAPEFRRSSFLFYQVTSFRRVFTFDPTPFSLNYSLFRSLPI